MNVLSYSSLKSKCEEAELHIAWLEEEKEKRMATIAELRIEREGLRGRIAELEASKSHAK